jgi:sugar-specific transcriptional regulator TrmB
MERIKSLLIDLGLSKDEAQIYIYLAKKGPQTKATLTEKLFIKRKELDLAIRGLEEKQITMRKSKHATFFSAIPFEKLLTNYAKIKLTQAKSIERASFSMIKDWANAVRETEPLESEKK